MNIIILLLLALYAGRDFTMNVPEGSTPVRIQNRAQTVDEDVQAVSTSYSFLNIDTSYDVRENEYIVPDGTLGALPESFTMEQLAKETAATVFAPGYSATFSKSHLGNLPAVEAEIEGTTVHRKTAFLKLRVAFSADRKHMWTVIVTNPDRRSFPKMGAENFMESIKLSIK